MTLNRLIFLQYGAQKLTILNSSSLVIFYLRTPLGLQNTPQMVGWQWIINHVKGNGSGIIWDSIPNLL